MIRTPRQAVASRTTGFTVNHVVSCCGNENVFFLWSRVVSAGNGARACSYLVVFPLAIFCCLSAAKQAAGWRTGTKFPPPPPTPSQKVFSGLPPLFRSELRAAEFLPEHLVFNCFLFSGEDFCPLRAFQKFTTQDLLKFCHHLCSELEAQLLGRATLWSLFWAHLGRCSRWVLEIGNVAFGTTIVALVTHHASDHRRILVKFFACLTN